MKLSHRQLDKLSELFLDLAKAAFISSFAVSVIYPLLATIITIKMIALGATFLFMSLKIVELQEVMS